MTVLQLSDIRYPAVRARGHSHLFGVPGTVEIRVCVPFLRGDQGELTIGAGAPLVRA